MTERGEHTPGPWIATEEGMPEDRLWRVYAADPNANEGDSLICEVNPLSGDDARLIAAAPELLEALEAVMIGGNHLALLIGADHPPYTATPDEALTHYGPGDTYEVWCCWRAIMNARDAAAKARGGAE